MRRKLLQLRAEIARVLPAPLKKIIRRASSLAYWTVTGQLFFRLKERRASELGIIPDEIYAEWIRRYDTLSKRQRAEEISQLDKFTDHPLISVIALPRLHSEKRLIVQTINSLKGQIYSKWELITAEGAQPFSDETYASTDQHISAIKYQTGVSATLNVAIDHAEGRFIVFLTEGDILSELAFAKLVAAINLRQDVDIIYSDGDQMDEEGRRHSPLFETDWNIDLFLGRNILAHLCAYRRDLVSEIGGIRGGFDDACLYDLAMRAVEATSPAKILHIPSILHHSSAENSSCSDGRAFENRRRVVQDHFSRIQQPAFAERHPASPDWVRVRRLLPQPAPRISIIVPTRDKPELIGPCVEGLLNRTDYPSFEVVIVDHESREPETLALFERFSKDSRVRIMPYTGTFNYSAINNAAVATCDSPLICLLNNDIDIISSNWLAEMAAYAVLPNVGAVGAKLLYPDDRVQHAGVLLRRDSVGSHFHHFAARHDPGHGGHAVLPTTVSAVTAACLVVQRAVFDEVGGLNERDLAVAFNDVDLCLKIKEAGYRNVMVPYAELYHCESASRGSDFTREKIKRFRCEMAYMCAVWGETLQEDSFYNLNCSQNFGNFALDFSE